MFCLGNQDRVDRGTEEHKRYAWERNGKETKHHPAPWNVCDQSNWKKCKNHFHVIFRQLLKDKECNAALESKLKNEITTLEKVQIIFYFLMLTYWFDLKENYKLEQDFSLAKDKFNEMEKFNKTLQIEIENIKQSEKDKREGWKICSEKSSVIVY